MGSIGGGAGGGGLLSISALLDTLIACCGKERPPCKSFPQYRAFRRAPSCSQHRNLLTFCHLDGPGGDIVRVQKGPGTPFHAVPPPFATVLPRAALWQVLLTYLVAWAMHDRGPAGAGIHAAAQRLGASAIAALDAGHGASAPGAAARPVAVE